ncbi:hypothetical protein [Streptomyces sp. NPDC003697]
MTTRSTPHPTQSVIAFTEEIRCAESRSGTAGGGECEGVDGDPVRGLVRAAVTARPLDEVAQLVTLLEQSPEYADAVVDVLRAVGTDRPVEDVARLVSELTRPPREARSADEIIRAAVESRDVEDVTRLMALLHRAPQQPHCGREVVRAAVTGRTVDELVELIGRLARQQRDGLDSAVGVPVTLAEETALANAGPTDLPGAPPAPAGPLGLPGTPPGNAGRAGLTGTPPGCAVSAGLTDVPPGPAGSTAPAGAPSTGPADATGVPLAPANSADGAGAPSVRPSPAVPTGAPSASTIAEAAPLSGSPVEGGEGGEAGTGDGDGLDVYGGERRTHGGARHGRPSRRFFWPGWLAAAALVVCGTAHFPLRREGAPPGVYGLTLAASGMCVLLALLLALHTRVAVLVAGIVLPAALAGAGFLAARLRPPELSRALEITVAPPRSAGMTAACASLASLAALALLVMVRVAERRTAPQPTD